MWILESSNLLVNDSRITSTRWCIKTCSLELMLLLHQLSLISHFSYLPTCVLQGSFNIWSTLFISTSSLLVNLDDFNVHSSSNFSQSLLLIVFNEICLLPFQSPKTTRLLSSKAVPSPLKSYTQTFHSVYDFLFL